MSTLNISRDTTSLELQKNYTKVLLQMETPLLDWDWNLSQNLMYARIKQFYEDFVGNGFLGDSYLITESINPNDFVITGNSTLTNPAMAVYSGLRTRLNSNKLYSEQIYSYGEVNNLNGNLLTNYDNDYYVNELSYYNITFTSGTEIGNTFRILSNNKNVLNVEDLNTTGVGIGDTYYITLPALTTPTFDRTDIVYLDIYTKIINGNLDPDIIHPALNYETCQREQIVGVIKVAENSTTIPTNANGHYYLPVAEISRLNGQTNISTIVDLRNIITVDLATIEQLIERNFIIDKQQGNKAVIKDEKEDLVVQFVSGFTYRVNTGYANYNGKVVGLDLDALITIDPPDEMTVGDYLTKLDYESHIVPGDGVVILDHVNMTTNDFYLTDSLDIDIIATDYAVIYNQGKIVISNIAYIGQEVRVYYNWLSQRKDYIGIDYESNVVVLKGDSDGLGNLPANPSGIILLAQINLSALDSVGTSPVDIRKFMHAFKWGEKQLQLHKDAIVLDPNYEGALTASDIYTSLVDGSLTIEDALNYVHSFIRVYEREFYGIAGDTVFETDSLDYVDITRTKEFYRQIPLVKDGFVRRYRFKVIWEDNIPTINPYKWIYLAIRKYSDDTIKKEFRWSPNNLDNKDYWISDLFELEDLPITNDDDRDLKISIMGNNASKSLSGSMISPNAIKVYKIVLEAYDIIYDTNNYLLYNEGLYNQGLYPA